MTSKASDSVRSYWTGPRDDPRRFRLDGVDGTLLEYAHGGEGAVFRAVRTDSTADSPVALKLMADVTLDEYARIHDRCLAISEVSHPNVMHQEETFIGSAFWNESQPDAEDFEVVFCVAQWIEGQSLHEAVLEASLTRRLAWVCQIARAVHHLHQFRSSEAPNGIIHRDIKPSNVRIQNDGQAVLIDFGMSRPNHGSDLTGGAGTFLWMAPESIGDAPTTGSYSDVWGVGALAHWLVTGIPPRLDDSTTIRRERIVSKCRELGRRPSRTLARRIASTLEASPMKRPRDLTKWSQDIERIGAKAKRRHLRMRRMRQFILRPIGFSILVSSVAALSVGVGAVTLRISHDHAVASRHNASILARFHKYEIVIPGSSSGEVSEYAGPSSRDRVTGSLSDHATIYIVCQTSGTEVGYPEYTVVWDLLNTGNYVSDFFTDTPTPYNFSAIIPRCST